MSDKPVRVVQQYRILPEHPGARQEYVLGPLDCLLAPFTPVAVLFVYEATNNSSSELLPVARYKQGLKTTLSHYPVIAGRLRIDETTGGQSVGSLDAGALLVEATCFERLDAFQLPERRFDSTQLPSYSLLHLPAAGNALFCSFSPQIDSVLAGPVLSVIHTRFACGSVAVGLRVLHTVCDGAGFVQFAKDLAAVYSGVLGGAAVLPSDAETPFVPRPAQDGSSPRAPPFMYTLGSEPPAKSAECSLLAGKSAEVVGKELYFPAD